MSKIPIGFSGSSAAKNSFQGWKATKYDVKEH
jgi:hypothetical protein